MGNTGNYTSERMALRFPNKAPRERNVGCPQSLLFQKHECDQMST